MEDYDRPDQPSTAMEKQAYDRKMTVRGRLAAQKKHLTDQLANLQKIEELLDRNPDIEQFQDLMAKVHL
jgi:hypothetical protein